MAARRFMSSGIKPIQYAAWGLLSRQERWSLSWRGLLVAIALIAAVVAAGIVTIYPFFAITAPTKADFLAVEGWVHEYAIRAAADEFNRGGYRQVFTTGGPVRGLGGYINDFSTSASIGASRLKSAGIRADRVQMVPSRVSSRDRTYAAAAALRDWLRENDIAVTNINIVTEDLHARRTRLLFQEAFGSDVAVGVIAVPSPDYDPKHWWRYSEGVRDVLGEVIAYLYAKFIFFPPPPPPPGSSHLSRS